MSWLRPAAIYLTLTALIAGSLWLFWGKAIESKWKKLTTEAAETKKQPAEPKKIRAKATRAEGKTDAKVATAKEEWQKTQSGFLSLICAVDEDNRRNLQMLRDRNEDHWRKLLSLKKKPTVMSATPQPSRRKVK